jgi:hypothetical protein
MFLKTFQAVSTLFIGLKKKESEESEEDKDE